MTLSTSLVAVWYSSDSSRSPVRSCNSLSSRAFSIAMTAWSAKVLTNAICLLRKRLDPLARQREDTDGLALTQQRHARARRVAQLGRLGQLIFRVGSDVGDVTTRRSSAARRVTLPRLGRATVHGANASYSGGNPRFAASR